MVNPDDLKHIGDLAVVDPVRRHRPRADSPSVTKKNLPPFDGLSCKHTNDFYEPGEKPISSFGIVGANMIIRLLEITPS
jgi:hypothetical protein